MVMQSLSSPIAASIVRVPAGSRLMRALPISEYRESKIVLIAGDSKFLAEDVLSGERFLVSEYGRLPNGDGTFFQREDYFYAEVIGYDVHAMPGCIVIRSEGLPEKRNGFFILEYTQFVERGAGFASEPEYGVVMSCDHADLGEGDRIAFMPAQGLQLRHEEFALVPQGEKWVFLRQDIDQVIFGIIE